MILDSTETKEKILAEFLKICSFDGWSEEALSKAINICGIDEKFSQIIFENSCLGLAEFYCEFYNQKSAEKIAKIENFSDQKIRDKIRFSLYARFEVESENQIALQRLMNFYFSPKNFTSVEMGLRPSAQGFAACYNISDFIWKNIGDQSTDFSFYSKRLILAKIIWRSLLVFVKEEPKNSGDSFPFPRTKSLIDSQIEKVMKFEQSKTRLKTFSSLAKSGLAKVFLDSEGGLKSPKEFVKNLPFFRLF